MVVEILLKLMTNPGMQICLKFSDYGPVKNVMKNLAKFEIKDHDQKTSDQKCLIWCAKYQHQLSKRHQLDMKSSQNLLSINQVIWTDWACTAENPLTELDPQAFENLTRHQIINYFPNSFYTFTKSRLTFNLKRMQKLHPDQYDFFPKSFILNQEIELFEKYLSSLRSPASLNNNQRSITNNDYFIVKPKDGLEGKDIFVTDLKDENNNLISASDPVIKNKLVCEYISNPLLIDGYKTDLRIHVLITSLEPLEIYVHKEGYLKP